MVTGMLLDHTQVCTSHTNQDIVCSDTKLMVSCCRTWQSSQCGRTQQAGRHNCFVSAICEAGLKGLGPPKPASHLSQNTWQHLVIMTFF